MGSVSGKVRVHGGNARWQRSYEVGVGERGGRVVVVVVDGPFGAGRANLRVDAVGGAEAPTEAGRFALSTELLLRRGQKMTHRCCLQ